MKTLKILLLGAGNRTEFAQMLQKSVLNYNMNPIIISYENHSLRPINNFAKVIVGKSFEDKETITKIKSIIIDNKIQICLSLNDKANFLLPKISNFCFAPAPSTKLIKIFEDKLEMNHYLDSINIKTIPSAKNPPLVIKPRKGSASKGIYFIKSKKELSGVLKVLNSDNYLLQKWLRGNEISVDAYKSSTNRFFFTIRKRLKVIQGECVECEFITSIKISKIISKILEIPEIQGPMNIQLIQDNNKNYLVSDINARFGGGITLSAKAGVPWTDFLISDYLNKNWPDFNFDINAKVVKTFTSYRVK